MVCHVTHMQWSTIHVEWKASKRTALAGVSQFYTSLCYNTTDILHKYIINHCVMWRRAYFTSSASLVKPASFILQINLFQLLWASPCNHLVIIVSNGD